MSEVAYERGLQPNEAPLDRPGQKLLSVWDERRSQAISSRRNYEPTWSICEHFLAGRQWVGWAAGGRGAGRVVTEPNPYRRERHTVDVITPYVQTVLGKLFAEDLRPTIVFTRDDAESETITTHTRQMARYMWDSELDAEDRIYEMLHMMLTYGTAAMRCFFDTTKGEELGEFPIGPDGEPILDPAQARVYVAQAQMQGVQLQFMPLREGRVTWEALSPRQILVPAGVAHEDYFPWLIIERPMPLGWAKMKYPAATSELREQDLSTSNMISVTAETIETDRQASPGHAGRLKGHVLVTTGYEMPNDEYPNGRTITWVNEQKAILEVRDSLPYKLHGNPHHGITFFHYHRLPHRFWSKGLVEPLIGPQRQKNRARSQMIEMKDRNLGRVYAKKGTITAANKPVGKIMELIEIPLHADYPQETQGVPPGPWIENEARINDEDMDRVAGLQDVSLGAAPTGVTAYSAMALLAEQDERRIGPVLKMIRKGIGDAMMLSLELGRRYWMEGKQKAISGPSGEMELFMFVRSRLPVEFYMDVSRHAPLPTSPAVEAQKIFDLFNAATSAGQPLPVEWLKTSLDQGRAMAIPKREDQVQMGKAQLENVMMAEGQIVVPDYYDDDYLHITIHRQQQFESLANEQSNMILEQHIMMHVQNAQLKRPSAVGGNVPQMQGAHGIEGQTGNVASQQGLAQSAAGEAPLTTPGYTQG